MSEKLMTKTIAQNKKAYHEYFVEEKFESGIELFGTEVKSVRLGQLNLKDSWCDIKNGEIFINQMHISPYEKGNIFNKDPIRKRKLLLHKKEISKLFELTQRDGYSVIPLSVYFKGSLIKISIGVCKGKKLYDKRHDAAIKDTKRTIDRALKEQSR